MTHEALPTTPYGHADWQDYVDFWRDADATWIQDRTITRFETTADRNDQIPSPTFGRTVYNYEIDRLETYSRQRNGWIPVVQLLNLAVTKDDTAEVALSHRESGGKGVVFTPNEIRIDNNLKVLNGILAVDSMGVAIKTGPCMAMLSTDADFLITDCGIRVPSLQFSGTGTTAITTGNKNINMGTGVLTVKDINFTGTLAGGAGTTLNVGKATINGVLIGHQANVINTNWFISQAGSFRGDADGAIVQQRNPSTGGLGTTRFEVLANDSYFIGGNVRFQNTIRIENPTTPIRNILYVSPGVDAYFGPVIFSETDPGAANYPRGTLWITP